MSDSSRGSGGRPTEAMLAAHPDPAGIDAALLARCIEACFDCAQVCTMCADACLSEKNAGDLADCIRTDLDCANVCLATGQALARQTAFDPAVVRTLLDACRTACATCAADCEEHGEHMEHCRICAQACRRCEQACTELLAALA